MIQGPAVGVVPVLNPVKPWFSNKFVFVHFTQNYFPLKLLYAYHVYYFDETILEIYEFLLVIETNFPRSMQFDLFALSANPCGLEKLVFFNPKILPIWFIIFINKFTNVIYSFLLIENLNNLFILNFAFAFFFALFKY